MAAVPWWSQPIDATFYSLAIERGMLKMKQRPRIYYSYAQKALMWERWQKGDSLHAVARFFDRGHSSVQRILSETGGIRPRQRRRSRLALTLSEREEISRGVVAGHSIRCIAESLGRAPSTVSREINRNGSRRRYRANKADQAAWDRSHRAKSCKHRRELKVRHEPTFLTCQTLTLPSMFSPTRPRPMP